MVLMLVATTVLITVSSYAYILTKRYLEILDKIEEFKDVTEMAIEVLIECHKSLDEKTKIDVFSDEPVIRDLVQDMARARDSVLKIVNVLDEVGQTFDAEEQEIQDDEKKNE